MEPEVQKAPPLPRSELDAAFDVSRAGGWVVVQGMPTTPRGYDVWPIDGTPQYIGQIWMEASLVVS